MVVAMSASGGDRQPPNGACVPVEKMPQNAYRQSCEQQVAHLFSKPELPSGMLSGLCASSQSSCRGMREIPQAVKGKQICRQTAPPNYMRGSYSIQHSKEDNEGRMTTETTERAQKRIQRTLNSMRPFAVPHAHAFVGRGYARAAGKGNEQTRTEGATHTCAQRRTKNEEDVASGGQVQKNAAQVEKIGRARHVGKIC